MKGERLEEPQLMEEPQVVEDPEFMEEAQFLEELQLEVIDSGSGLDPEDLGLSPDFATNLMLELEKVTPCPSVGCFPYFQNERGERENGFLDSLPIQIFWKITPVASCCVYMGCVDT